MAAPRKRRSLQAGRPAAPAQVNGLYVHASPPRVVSVNLGALRQWLRGGEVDKLQQMVLEGQGARLLGEFSPDPKVRAFLRWLPNCLNKVDSAHAAAALGQVAKLESVLGSWQAGANAAGVTRMPLVLCKDRAGTGLLHKAVFKSNRAVADWLIDNYPETVNAKDREGRTALHYCGACDDPQGMWKRLVQAGADPEVTDSRGRTASYYMERPEELRLPTTPINPSDARGRQADGLVVKPANIRIWIHDRDIAKLQQLLWEGYGGRLRSETSKYPSVKRFLDAVPFVMGAIKDVHIAAVAGDLPAFRRQTADPVPMEILTSKDSNGLTPLHKAAGLGNSAVVDDIVSRVPRAVSITDAEGRTPLHYAALVRDQGEVYSSLVRAGADELAQDNLGRNADYYKSKPADIDSSVLRVIPDAPRTSATFPPGWDWCVLTDPLSGGRVRQRPSVLNGRMTNGQTDVENYPDDDNTDSRDQEDVQVSNGEANHVNGYSENSIGESNELELNEGESSQEQEDQDRDDVCAQEVQLRNGNGSDEESKGHNRQRRAVVVVADDEDQDIPQPVAPQNEESLDGDEEDENGDLGTEDADGSNDRPNDGNGILITSDDIEDDVGNATNDSTDSQNGDNENNYVEQGDPQELDTNNESSVDGNNDDNQGGNEPTGQGDEDDNDDEQYRLLQANWVISNVLNGGSLGTTGDENNSGEGQKRDQDPPVMVNDDSPDTKLDEEPSDKTEEADGPRTNNEENTDNIEENGPRDSQEDPGGGTEEEEPSADPDESNPGTNTQAQDEPQSSEEPPTEINTNRDDSVTDTGNEGTENTDQFQNGSGNDSPEDSQNPGELSPGESTGEQNGKGGPARSAATTVAMDQDDGDSSDPPDPDPETELDPDPLPHSDTNPAPLPDPYPEQQESRENPRSTYPRPPTPRPPRPAKRDQGEEEDLGVVREGGEATTEQRRGTEGRLHDGLGLSGDAPIIPRNDPRLDDMDVDVLIAQGQLGLLADMVLNGDGDRLVGKTSDNEAMQSFLDNVPMYMTQIRAVHSAARSGDLRGLQESLDRRRYAVARDKRSGTTPLQCSVILGQTAIVRYLAGRFPETLTATDRQGRTPLHFAATLADNGHYFNLLLNLGADRSIKDQNGLTPDDYIQRPGIVTHKQLLSEIGAPESIADDTFSDKVPSDTVSSRRDVADQEATALMDRVYTMLREAATTHQDNPPPSAVLRARTAGANTGNVPDVSYKEAPVVLRYVPRLVFDKCKCVTTRMDHSLLDVLWPTIFQAPEDEARPYKDRDSHMEEAGVIAPDYESYAVYARILLPVIKALNGFDVKASLRMHPPNQFFEEESEDVSSQTTTVSSLSKLELRVDEATQRSMDLDPGGRIIVRSSVQCARNLEDFNLPANLSEDDLDKVEDLLRSVLLTGKLPPGPEMDPISQDTPLRGEYFPFDEIPFSIRHRLRAVGLWPYIPRNEVSLRRMQGKHWPRGRGLFVSNESSIVAWINVQDHLRIMAASLDAQGGKLGLIFRNMAETAAVLDEVFKFKRDQELGFLTARPWDVGSTVRFSVAARLPRLGREPETIIGLCKSRGIRVRYTSHSEVYLLSNKQVLGIAEYQVYRDFVTAMANILHLEQRLGENTIVFTAMLKKLFRKRSAKI